MDPEKIPDRIEVIKRVNFGELDSRLRNVKLRGFPDVKIYNEADIEIKEVSPDEIKRNICTPQPRVYRTFIDRILHVAEMFKEQGVDIFRLTEGYDYAAYYADGSSGTWTIIPPVVEVVPIGFLEEGGLNYSGQIGDKLKEVMAQKGYKINPELRDLNFAEFAGFRRQPGVHSVPVICDGSNRVHAAMEKGIEQHLLFIESPAPGFPYYAAPKPYSTVHVENVRVDGSKSDKVHVLTEPGHKELYRLFPSGGILSGDVRPDKPKGN